MRQERILGETPDPVVNMIREQHLKRSELSTSYLGNVALDQDNGAGVFEHLDDSCIDLGPLIRKVSASDCQEHSFDLIL